MPEPLPAKPSRKRGSFPHLPHLYLGLMRRHGLVTALVAVTLASIYGECVWLGKPVQHLAYLAAVALSVIVVDLICLNSPAEALPVRWPGLELGMAGLSLMISVIFLFMVFGVIPAGPPSLTAKLLRVAGLLVVLNIALALIDLLALRYRFRDLGFRFAAPGLRAVPLIHSFFYSLSYVTGAPMTFRGVLQE